MKPDVRVYPDLEALSRGAAELVIDAAKTCVRRKGFFTLVLSGGATPKRLYTLLGEEYRDQMPWHSTHIFWGDERNTPQTSLESNYRMAYETLISKAPIPVENIHSVPTTPGNPESAAQAYEKIIGDFFQTKSVDAGGASFDFVLLGLGSDGHTASLFPGDPILDEKSRWVCAVHAPPTYQTRERITLTLPAINSADQAVFMVSGSGKKEIVKTILNDPARVRKKLPAAMIQPKEELKWLLDTIAAEELKK
ncbi:MAG: 6-phosphogluconolactonase [Candidatus Hydrothermarchaeales archaeon]